MFLKITAIVFLIVYLAGCGGSKTTENEFLGKFPSLEKNFAEKIKAKQDAFDKAHDLNSALKLSKEIEELKEKKKNNIKEYLDANPLVKPLPLVALEGTPYTINQVVVNVASAGNLNIKFDIKIDQDIISQWGNVENTLFVYYKAVDKNGEDIANSKTVATNFGKSQLLAGSTYEAFGSWGAKVIGSLENFAKIVEITKEEYQGK